MVQKDTIKKEEQSRYNFYSFFDIMIKYKFNAVLNFNNNII